MDEVTGGDVLLAFRLYFEKCESRASRATNEQPIVLDQQFSGWNRMLSYCRIPNLQILATKSGEGAGPWLEPTQPVVDLLCGEMEIHSPIFLFQNRRESRFRMILLTSLDCAGLQSLQGLDDEVRADRSQRRSKSFGGIGGIDRDFFLHQDVAGVESSVNSHRCDPGDSLTASYRPLDGRRAAILG